MSDYKVTDMELTALANAIRAKGGTQANLEWNAGFISAVNNITVPTGSINITQNGTHDVTNYASANVHISGGSAVLVPKTITQNGTYDPTNDNADGYSNVIVSVPNSHALPTGYAKTLYTKGDGTAYVNTGVSPTENTWLNISAMIVKQSNNVYAQEIGTRESYGVKSWQLNSIPSAITNIDGTFSNDSNDFHYSTNNDRKFMNIKINNNNDNSFVVNNSIISQNLTLRASVYPFYIFALNQANSKAGDASISYFFEIIIGDGNNEVAHFIPCIRESDSNAGFYDIARNAFYGNAINSGNLIAGPIL